MRLDTLNGFAQNFKDCVELVSLYTLEISEEHGFTEDGNEGERIALMHSELSEALEAIRKGWPESSKIQGDAVTEELADCVIRIFNFCKKRQLPLAKAIIDKTNYNNTRPFKHGKEF